MSTVLLELVVLGVLAVVVLEVLPDVELVPVDVLEEVDASADVSSVPDAWALWLTPATRAAVMTPAAAAEP